MGKLPFEGMKRKIIIKTEAKGEFGTEPENRKTEDLVQFGFVNVDKPSGPTSHNVAAFVRQILCLEKAGHSGTLDPAVTGCLPVALERATRLNEEMLLAGKEYVCIMHVHEDVGEEKITKELEEFVGVITQLPPRKSAVKRAEREREIYYLKVLEVKGKDVLFIVGCESGTYIRKICHDYGQKIGCGAHMKELRRTKAGPFDESSLCTLQELKDAYVFWTEKNDDTMLRKCILPAEKAVEYVAKVWILDEEIKKVSHGRNIFAEKIAKLNEFEKDEDIAIMTLKGEVIAIGEALMSSEEILKKNSVAVKTRKVLIEKI